jgi:hypothetical protein
MVAVHFNLHTVTSLFADARMVPENKLLGLKVKQMGFFKYETDGLLLQLASGLVQVLDDLEVGLFVFEQQRLNLRNVLQRVDAEDLVEELAMFGREVLQGLSVDAPQTEQVRKLVLQQQTQHLGFRRTVLELRAEYLLETLVVAEVLQVAVELLRQGILAYQLHDLREKLIRQILGLFDQFSGEIRIVAKCEIEQFSLRLVSLGAVDLLQNILAVTIRLELISNKLLISIERAFQVFIYNMQQIFTYVVNILPVDLPAFSTHIRHPHLLTPPTYLLLLQLEVLQQRDNRSDSLLLRLLVLDQQFDHGQFEGSLHHENPLEQHTSCLVTDLGELLAAHFGVDHRMLCLLVVESPFLLDILLLNETTDLLVPVTFRLLTNSCGESVQKLRSSLQQDLGAGEVVQ